MMSFVNDFKVHVLPPMVPSAEDEQPAVMDFQLTDVEHSTSEESEVCYCHTTHPTADTQVH